jgi:hypothetical protein
MKLGTEDYRRGNLWWDVPDIQVRASSLDRAGVARRSIVGIEAGTQRTRPATVRALATALITRPEGL